MHTYNNFLLKKKVDQSIFNDILKSRVFPSPLNFVFIFENVKQKKKMNKKTFIRF